MNVFITGISGCVGHYVFDALADLPDLHLYLLVRDASKLRFDAQRPNVTLIHGDAVDLTPHADLLKTMDAMIHIAAAWGEEVAYQVNRDATFAMLDMADPARLQKLILFSTASVLDRENALLDAAWTDGTDYIKSKYQCLKDLPAHALSEKVITLFPTLVFGGDERHPTSHLTSGIPEALKWVNIARWVDLDASFHFVHGADIAQVVKHVLLNDVSERWLVLGNAETTVRDLVKTLSEHAGKPYRGWFNLEPLLKLLAPLLLKQMNSWDRFCMAYKHFRYRVVNPATFGMTPAYPTLKDVLKAG